MADRTRGDRDGRTVAAYAAELGSDSPSPGGGSAVAVTAALAAALGEKVSRLSIGKPGYEQVEQTMIGTRDAFDDMRQTLLSLAQEDEIAYVQYVRSTSMPKSTDEEKAGRRAAMNEALLDAATVPLKVANLCLRVLVELESVAALGNKNLISDVSVASHLAGSALQGAVCLVRANAAYLKTPEASALAQQADALADEGRSANASIQDICDSR